MFVAEEADAARDVAVTALTSAPRRNEIAVDSAWERTAGANDCRTSISIPSPIA